MPFATCLCERCNLRVSLHPSRVAVCARRADSDEEENNELLPAEQVPIRKSYTDVDDDLV